jgi:hypothetical protein
MRVNGDELSAAMGYSSLTLNVDREGEKENNPGSIISPTKTRFPDKRAQCANFVSFARLFVFSSRELFFFPFLLLVILQQNPLNPLEAGQFARWAGKLALTPSPIGIGAMVLLAKARKGKEIFWNNFQRKEEVVTPS